MSNKWIVRLNFLVLAVTIVGVLAIQAVFWLHLARLGGADTACATAKECPPDFKAKWVEAGCVCVPAAAARR